MTPTARTDRPHRGGTARSIRANLRSALGATIAVVVTGLLVGTSALLVATPDASAQPGATTTTDPVDNRRLGEIIPEPNSGRTPETAGDPGGWLQVSLFFLICLAIVGIVLIVWRQSRKARDRRSEAGLDPVEVAKRRGQGVRPPR